ERRRVVVVVVAIAPGSVALPELNQGARDRAAVLVQDPPGDDDPLAERLAGVLTRQVVVGFADRAVAEQRAGELGDGVRQLDERQRRGAAHRGFVRWVGPLRPVDRVRAGKYLHSKPLSHDQSPGPAVPWARAVRAFRSRRTSSSWAAGS